MKQAMTAIHTVTDTEGEYWARLSDIISVAKELNWSKETLGYLENLKTGNGVTKKEGQSCIFV